MRVLGIYGSPRKGGNSDKLLDRALEGVREARGEVSIIRASDHDVTGCRGCGGCDKSGECVIQDAMQKLYPELDEAERIILASPIYFYSFPAQLKALVDRIQSRWARQVMDRAKVKDQVLSTKKGYLIAVGATRGKKLFEGVELTAKYFFHALGMTYEGGLFYRNVDEKDAITKVPHALQQAYQLGMRVVGQETPK